MLIQALSILSSAGNIIMAVDKAAKWLVTGDQDGLIKVWNIANYCVEDSVDLVVTLPGNRLQFELFACSIFTKLFLKIILELFSGFSFFYF